MSKFLVLKKDKSLEVINITNIRKNDLAKATQHIIDTRWHYRTDQKGRIKCDDKGNGVKANLVKGVSIV
jgi:hypothetical protein